jgi:hypothetical protein
MNIRNQLPPALQRELKVQRSSVIERTVAASTMLILFMSAVAALSLLLMVVPR